MTDTANLARVGEGVTADINGNVGIGTGSIPASANVFSVYGTAMHYGNLVIQNRAAGGSGIYFADGTFLITANSGGNYSNANVISYLSGPVQVGNLTINNTTASTSTVTGALLMGGGAGIQGAVHVGGLIYGTSTLNIAGAAQVNSLASNGAVSGTTGTFTSALYGASFNTAGTATVNALASNGAITGTTGAFSTSLYSATFNTAGTATVNALASNGAITATTITGTVGTFTSLQNSGTTTTNALVSNVYGLFGQNVTVNSTNAATTTTNGALTVAGGIGVAGNVISGGNLVHAGASTLSFVIASNSIVGSSIISNTTIQSSLTATVNTLVSNVYGLFGQNVTINSTNASTAYTAGALLVAGGVGITGNINVNGANNLFTNKVGIGTSTILGARANVLAVYGTENLYGNLIIANTATGGSGIYFPDGTYQQTAGTIGGVNQSVQYNNNGTFGGDTDFLYDNVNKRLGIGTASLTNSLMVFSATPALFNTTNGADQQVIVGNAAATGAVIGFNSSTGTGLNTYGYFSFAGAASKNISVISGKTGIGGVTIPQNTLEIGGTTVIGGTFSGNNNLINPPANGLAVQGAVGIGTFTPLSTLDVNGIVSARTAFSTGGTASVSALIANNNVFGATLNTSGLSQLNSLIANTNITTSTLNATSNVIVASLNSNTNVVATNIQSTGQASVASLIANANIYGATFNTNGLAQVANAISNGFITSGSLNSIGLTQTANLISNGYITTATLNSTGLATVNQLISNANIYGANINIAGPAQLASLIVNVNATTATLNVTGSAQVNSLISNAGIYSANLNIAGAALVGSLNSNTNVVGVNLQSTGLATVNQLISNANIFGANINISGVAQVSSLIGNNNVFGATLQSSGQAQLASLLVNANTTSSTLNVQNGAIVNSLIGNTNIFGATMNTSGLAQHASMIVNANTTSATLNVTGSAIVNSLTSNGAISGTTINGTAGTFTSLQVSGTTTTNTLVGNVYGLFGQNVTVNSTNASTLTTNGALVVAGGLGIAGNVNVGGSVSTFAGNVGIGATALAAGRALTLNGPSNYFGMALQVAGTTQAQIMQEATGSLYIDAGITNLNGVIVFRTAAGNERVRIDNSGNVGIGSATSIAGSIFARDITSNTGITATTLTLGGTATVNTLISNVYGLFSQNVTVNSTNASTSTGTGALIVTTGGVGVGGAVHAGGQIYTATTLNVAGAAQVNSLTSNVYGLFGQNVVVNSANASTSTATGALIVTTGGAGIAGNINVGGSRNLFTNSVGIGTSTATGTNSNVFTVYGTAQHYGNIVLQSLAAGGAGIYFADGTFLTTAGGGSGNYSNANVISYLSGPVQVGNLTINNTTASTSTITGALLMGGGAGIQGAIHVGGLIYGATTLNIAGAAQVNSLTSNGAISGTTINGTAGTFTSLQVSGTTTTNALVGNVYGVFGQNVVVNSANASTATSNGALVVAGGAGIAGNINVGGSRSLFTNSVGIGTSTATGVNSNVFTIYGTAQHYGNIVLQNLAAGGAGIYFADGSFQTSAAGSTTPYSNANVASYLSGPVQVGNLTINNTTASTSTVTGALLMGGGAGIQGAIHVGGLIYGATTLNIAGTATVNALASNGAITGTTGAFSTSLYSATFNTAGTATVNALVSNGAVSGTTGTFTSALYGASFNTAGTATVNALASNGAITGTTGAFSTSLYSATFNTAGTATVNALASNGAITGTTGAFSTSLYSATFNTAGTATVNALASNGAITATTITGTAGTFTSLQNSGTTTTNALVSNVYGLFGQNVVVNSANASTATSNGALIITTGGAGIAGNINAGGSRSLFTGAVGIGTSTAAGMIAATGVSNDAYHWGNVRIANTATTSSGIIFPDGTVQNTAGSPALKTNSFGTAGTIQFAGAGNTFLGDTANFFWDDTNNRLGIGTATPGQTVSAYSTEAVLFNTRPGGAARQEITVGNVTTYGAVLGYDPSIGNSIGYLRRGDSAAGTPAITWAYGTGAYRVGINGVTQPQNTMDISGTVAIGSGFSGFAAMTNTNGLSVQGSVGIGTFTPSTSANNLTLWSATGAGIQLTSGGTAGGGNIQAVTGGGLKFSTFTGGVGVEVYTERMRFDAAGDVGIGVADPLSPLDVSGIASFRSAVSVAGAAAVSSFTSNTTITASNATGPQITFTGATSQWIQWPAAGVAAPTFTTSSTGTKLLLYPNIAAGTTDYAIGIENATIWNSVPSTGQQFKWYGGTTQAMLLSGAGALTTTSTTTSTAFIPNSATVPTNGIYLPAADTVGIAAGTTERMRVTTTGVGFGGAQQNSFNVTVNGGALGTVANSQVRMLNIYATDTNNSSLEFSDVRNASGGTDWTTAGMRMQQKIDATYMGWVGFNNGNTVTTNNGGISFGAGLSGLGPNGVPEVMRITSTGVVGILTTAPISTLDVNGVISARTAFSTAGAATVASVTSNGTVTGTAFVPSSATVPTNGIYLPSATALGWAVSSTAVMSLTKNGTNATANLAVTGNITATGEVTAYYSDARLKDNITLITNAMDKVSAINGVYYNPSKLAETLLHESRHTSKVGLIAQEVEAVLPHVIRSAPFDTNIDGSSKSGENYKTIQYEKVIPLLVEAIKELEARIAKLEGRS